MNTQTNSPQEPTTSTVMPSPAVMPDESKSADDVRCTESEADSTAPDEGRNERREAIRARTERERSEQARTDHARADSAARRHLASWLREASEAKENYPGFDLGRELRGKSGAQFRALIRSGVDMSTAYEVVHAKELIPAAIRAAAREIEDKITGGIVSGSVRPAENSLGGGGSLPAMLGIGVSHMSRADRDDIARRVARGEIIKL